MKKLALYVHIPFCASKCKYCDFNSFRMNDIEKIGKYIDSVCNEIEYFSKSAVEFNVSSVYFGGGTPSFISEKYIEKILCTIFKKFNVTDDAEITIEANPGTVNFEKLSIYRGLGINRISFGVQTLNDKLLNYIGRVHTASEAESTLYTARKVGFNNINLDIMFGLPYQELSDVAMTVESFVKYGPEHISAYSLKVEENTEFGRMHKRGELKLPDEAIEREMYYLIKEKLKEAGYIQYEISNFSKKGYESIHNTAYWKRQDYLGFGISAASCFNEVRFSNTGNFESYINNPTENFFEYEELTKDIIDSEKIILGLRLLEGVNEELFYKESWKVSLEKLIKNNLLKREIGKICLTTRGLDLANQVFVEFI